MIASLDRPTSSGTHDLSRGRPTAIFAVNEIAAPGALEAPGPHGMIVTADGGVVADQAVIHHRPARTAVVDLFQPRAPSAVPDTAVGLAGDRRGPAVRRGHGEAVAHAGP
jgi:hypothetical protein